MITELIGEGMSTVITMKMARHKENSYKIHLRYNRLSLADVQTTCDKITVSQRGYGLDYTAISTAHLKNMLEAIKGELRKRNK